jgi:hypothetical protein
MGRPSTEQVMRERSLQNFARIDTLVNTISRLSTQVLLDYIEVFTHKDGRVQKIKYSILSDSYEFQCYARAQVWDTNSNEWHHVYSIPYSLMKTEAKMYYWPASRNINFSNFSEDFETLRHTALKIVF